MPDDELLGLVSTLSRLTHPRCATPRVDALRKAYRRIRNYAIQRGLTEEWCDRVMLMFAGESQVTGGGVNGSDAIGSHRGTVSHLQTGAGKLGPAGVTVPLRVLKSGDVQEVAVKSADRMATLRKPKGV